jgi:hypothetical protein
MAKKKEEPAEKPADAGLAPRGDAPLTAPDYIETDSKLGFENTEGRDFTYPVLRLMQATSPQVADGVARLGQIVNSLTNEVIVDVDEETDFVVAYHYPSWIQWAPKMGEGIVAASIDPTSELAVAARKGTMRPNSRKPLVTEYHNFVVLLLDHLDADGQPTVAVLSFAKTSYKTGRKLLMLARMKKRPLFAGIYALGTVKKEKDGNKYFEFTVDNSRTNGGFATKEVYELAKAGFLEFKGKVGDIEKQRQAAEGGAASEESTDEEAGDPDAY